MELPAEVLISEPEAGIPSASATPAQTEASAVAAAGRIDAAALRTAGQRRINILWEMTQAVVALSVNGATLYVATSLAVKDKGELAINLLSNAFFLVIGFYFGRTNHQRMGGIAPMPGETR